MTQPQQPKNRVISILINLFILFFTIGISLVAAEYLFRKLLFSDIKAFQNLRDPGFYSDYLNEDDYWKLYHIFGGDAKPPQNPHPVFGWIGDFNRNTLVHNKSGNIGNRKPVLLFGDSYAECMDEVICFQDILNNDSLFSKTNYLLNYGVGGFGVDQIYLLSDSVIPKYENPFVIFSLMNYDLDRTPMSFRIGQKPVYKFDGDSLILTNIPVNKDPDIFLTEHPVGIKSYLYRKFLYSDLNLFSDSINKHLKNWDSCTAYKKKLNQKILEQAIENIRARRLNHIFIVFHYIKNDEQEYRIENKDNWRDVFLRDFLESNRIPYIWSKDLILNDINYTGTNYDLYMLPDNGHPTTYLNQLISNEIKQRVLKNKKLCNGDISDILADMDSNKVWSSQLKSKAAENAMPLSLIKTQDAIFILKEMVNKGRIFPETGYYKLLIENDSVWRKDVMLKAEMNGVDYSIQLQSEAEYIYNLKNEY